MRKTIRLISWKNHPLRGLAVGISLAVLFACSRTKEAVPSSKAESAAAIQANFLSEQERADGWTLLFDGRSLEGWRGIGIAGIPEGHWVVEEGMIKKVAAGEVPRQADGQPSQGGDLMTAGAYEDFELRFEWKISPGGNSGVKYNVSEEISLAIPPKQAAIGFEYQILDDAGHPDAANGPTRTAGALYDLIPPGPKALNPVGEFNEARIAFRGGHGEHWLNGAKILEFDLDTPGMNERLAASKYRDIADFAKKRRGHIVLQDHGDAVWFRNVKIRELPNG
jgi:hypothetical protein